MSIPHSDALVFFGMTGDLAYKKIFPALLAMVLRDGLELSIIHFAHSDWNTERLPARAHDSVTEAAKNEGAAWTRPRSRSFRRACGWYDPQADAGSPC